MRVFCTYGPEGYTHKCILNKYFLMWKLKSILKFNIFNTEVYDMKNNQVKEILFNPNSSKITVAVVNFLFMTCVFCNRRIDMVVDSSRTHCFIVIMS